MATESPSDLWKLWKQEQITSEMAIGYLIQNQVNHEQVIQSANLTGFTLRRELDSFAAHLKTLQQDVTKLQRILDGTTRVPKQPAHKDDPNTSET